MTFNIKIADTIFTITTDFQGTYYMCKDYLTEKSGEPIIITKDDIDFERQKSIDENILEGIPVVDYPDDYLETISVYRKIANYFSFHNSALFHGALIEKDSNGYLFTAKSGVGKTTHIRNWIKAFPDTRIINGDKPILSEKNGSIIAYGTPYSGKEHYNINDSVKLKAIIIVKRDSTNHIEETSADKALPILLTQINKPSDGLGIKRAFEFITKLINSTKIYTLYCNMDVESAIVAYNGIK